MEPDTAARGAFTFPRLNATYVANDTEPSCSDVYDPHRWVA
jgi:hypothetical protein